MACFLAVRGLSGMLVGSLLASLVGCDRAEPQAGESRANAGLSSEAARTGNEPGPALVFAERELFIWGIGVQRFPPLTPGSVLNAAQLSSNNPSVVSIDTDGALRTHAGGTAVIRAASGSELTVRVRPAGALRIVPDPAEVTAGESLHLMAVSDGAVLPDGAAQWLTEDPAIAMPDPTGLTRSGHAGTTAVTVRVGDTVAKIQVTVREGRAPVFSLVSPAGPVRKGALVQISALPQPTVAAAWTSSRPQVLRSLSNGVFQALESGTARACLAVAGVSRCVPVQVQP
jgi:hypothetical protein